MTHAKLYLSWSLTLPFPLEVPPYVNAPQVGLLYSLEDTYLSIHVFSLKTHAGSESPLICGIDYPNFLKPKA